MDFKSILTTVLGVASPIVSAIVPGGGLAVEGIKAIAGAFGLKTSEVTTDKLAELAANDKDFALKLRQADQAYQLEIQKQETEQLKLELADVQSARQRDTESTKAGKTNWTAKILEWLIVLGFFATTAVRMYIKIDPSQLADVAMLQGALIVAFTTVVTFEYGTNVSSQRKTELLAKADAIK